MEKKLYDEGIISLADNLSGLKYTETSQYYSNKSIVQLELTLLDMGLVPELQQGIIYFFPVEIKGKCLLQ